MKALKGTGRLLRLALRLDRVRLPIWIIANVGLLVLTIQQLGDAYSTQADRAAYALATSSSIVSRMLAGALTGPSLGEITIVETFFLAAILTALMNIFLVVRHTRANEEANRTEVIGSAVVGRQAGLTAALILAFLANAVLSGLFLLAYVNSGFEFASSLSYSLGLGALGMTFAVIAAITAQLFENARSSSGMAGLLFGLAFMVRAVGDTFGQLLPGGMGVKSNLFSWFSPLGWVTNMHPFASDGPTWWAFGLFGGFMIVGTASAYWLLNKRDVGAGLVASRAGRLHASKTLLSRFGMVWRLNRTATIAWLVSLVLTGAALGGVAKEFGELIASNEEMRQLLSQIGGTTDVTDIMFGAMYVIVGITVSGYALQILTRMRAEESNERLEAVLATSTSRWSWLLTYTVYAVVTSTIILLLTGLAAGLVYGLIDGQLFEQLRSLSGSILVYVPAIAIMVGATLVVFGILPRLFISVAWGLLAACLLVFQLGALLKLPQWVINLSPFSHTPAAPIVDVSYTPLLIQAAVALGLAALGFVLFRRRDILTS